MQNEEAETPPRAPSPQPGSIALAAAPSARCRRNIGLLQHHDQLDRPRPVATACTVGAIEGASDLIFADRFDDGYAAEHETASTAHQTDPHMPLLVALEELARLTALFGFEAEALERFDAARKRVADWKAAR